jgi:hypothetical protein
VPRQETNERTNGTLESSERGLLGDYCLLLSSSVCVEKEGGAVYIRISYVDEGSKTSDLALVDAKNHKCEQ